MKFLACLLLSICSLLTAAMANAQAVVTVPPTESVNGQSQAEWSRAWWQWAASFKENSPVSDQTGAYCSLGQSGPVWFLAGTYGSRRTVRACKVPKGKHLFFPLVNYVVAPQSGMAISCQDAMDAAEEMMDEASALVLEVDGVRVPNLVLQRQATTKCFDLGLRAQEKIRIFPSAGNGYYVMLRPLSPGKHQINFGGVLPGTRQTISYTLEVE